MWTEKEHCTAALPNAKGSIGKRQLQLSTTKMVEGQDEWARKGAQTQHTTECTMRTMLCALLLSLPFRQHSPFLVNTNSQPTTNGVWAGENGISKEVARGSHLQFWTATYFDSAQGGLLLDEMTCVRSMVATAITSIVSCPTCVPRQMGHSHHSQPATRTASQENCALGSGNASEIDPAPNGTMVTGN